MDEKITKKVLDRIILEELEDLEEQEIDEIFGGIGRRLGAWSAGRKRKAQVKEWEAFKGNLGYKLNQLADMYEKAHADHNADIEKNPKLKQFASTFDPWKKADKGVEDQVKALRTQAKSVLTSPVEVSPDEAPEQAGDRLSGEETPAQPQARPTETGGGGGGAPAGGAPAGGAPAGGDDDEDIISRAKRSEAEFKETDLAKALEKDKQKWNESRTRQPISSRKRVTESKNLMTKIRALVKANKKTKVK